MDTSHVATNGPRHTPAVLTPRPPHEAPGAILVVENEHANRLLMEQILTLAGYACIAVSSGREALDALAAPGIALVLLDLSMPVLDGHRTRELIARLPGGAALPVVAVTAHALVGDRESALRAGFTEYLTKPFRPRDLLRLVEQIFATA